MATAADIVEERPETGGEAADGSAAPQAIRPRIALALALVGLVAAIVGAIGPVKRLHATYSWPPPRLPAGSPDRLWYAPLLLQRWRPEELTARLPCASSPALRSAGNPVTVLATVRHPDQIDGLVVTQRAHQLSVRIGETVLAQVPLDRPGTGKDCAYTLDVAHGRFTIAGGQRHLQRSGAVASMPIVNGLLSGLDLRAGGPLSVRVRTQSFATQTVFRQTLAWTLAAFSIVLALLLVAVERRPRPWLTTRRLVRAALRNARPVDLVVFALLLGWWVIAPVAVDDGWIQARGEMYSTTHGFSMYYAAFGANLPNDYWLEWVQHWLAQGTTALIVLRVPALVCLAATWVLCRWILARVLASSGSEGRLAVWSLASAFVVGAFAWGMTLRPEFATAFFAAAIMACAVRFLERRSAAPLALAAALLPLAATAHHAGLVAGAPLIAAGSHVIRWARRRPLVAAAISVASLALLGLLAFVGSDLEQRLQDAHDVSRVTGTPWLNELQRYATLVGLYSGTPMREASVALMLLAVLAFVFRRDREPRIMLDLPAKTVGIGLLLLVPLPDKLPWHFGALLALAAVAVAAETVRLRGDAARATHWEARPFLIIGVAMAATAWLWATPQDWSLLDLRTLDWSRAVNRLDMGLLALLAPLLAMVAATLAGMLRRDPRPWRVPWHVAPWMPVIIAVPVVAFTVGVILVDTATTPSWTLARQSLGSLGGRAGCGVADSYRVALPASTRPVEPVPPGRSDAVPAWVPSAPSTGLRRVVLGPSAGTRSVSPWFGVPSGRPVGIFVAGTPTPATSLLVEWGSRRRDKVVTLAQADLAAPPALQGGGQRSTGRALGSETWHLYPSNDIPRRPPIANALRIVLVGETDTRAAVAVTAPVTYSQGSLTSLIDHGAPTLVDGWLVTYVPCARLPNLKDGAAVAPAYDVRRPTNGPTQSGAQGPFAGVLDLYSATYLPVANIVNVIQDMVVVEVDRKIPGGEVASPTVSRSRS
jgi:arabinosyltransferase C